MRLYGLSRDGTLSGLVWRVGLPMLVGSPEMARKERGRAVADPKMSEGWVILAVEVEIVEVVPEPVAVKPEGG